MPDGLVVAYVFGLGMVAVVNPCGFAMLPAYVAFFVGQDETQQPFAARTLRAVTAALTVTAGFVVVFLLLGSIIRLTAGALVTRLPWVSIGLGAMMVALGVATLAGRRLPLRLPTPSRGPGDRLHRTMFVFGIGYALVSLSCTIPLFLASVMTGLTRDGVAAGMALSLAYAAGMGAVLVLLTLAVSFARTSMVGRLRAASGWVDRTSAVLLLVSGAYVTYYGWYSLRVYDGDLAAGGPASFVNNLSTRASDVIQSIGPARIAGALTVLLTVLLAVSLVAGWSARRRA